MADLILALSPKNDWRLWQRCDVDDCDARRAPDALGESVAFMQHNLWPGRHSRGAPSPQKGPWAEFLEPTNR
jgi:hypothetical protein